MIKWMGISSSSMGKGKDSSIMVATLQDCCIILVLIFVKSRCFFLDNIEDEMLQIKTDENTTYLYIDRLLGEEFEFICGLGKQGYFAYESYTRPVLEKNISDATDYRVQFIKTFDDYILHMKSLKLADSGTYACLLGSRTSKEVLKLAIHDPDSFLWVFTARGMAPTRYIELGRSRTVLKWSEWMSCDGCAGYGERKKMGFCYIHSNEHREVETLYQCQDLRRIKFYMRPLAKRTKNEVVVETCYEECDDDEDPFEPQSSLSFLAENGQSLTLNCPGDIDVRTAVRWERNFEVLMKKDYSFGYAPSKPYYIDNKNVLRVNNLNFGNLGRITVACVVWRRERHEFVAKKKAEPEGIAQTTEHLRMMAISCSIQLAVFLLILLILDATQAFAEGVSLQKNV